MVIDDLRNETKWIILNKDQEYTDRIKNTQARVNNELAQIQQAAAQQSRTPFEAAFSAYRMAVEWLESQHNAFTSIFPVAHGLEGHNPFYLTTYLSHRKMLETLNTATSPEDMKRAFESIGQSYGAALELKYLSLLGNAMGTQLAALSHHAIAAGAGHPLDDGDWAALLAAHSGLIDRESKAQLNRLPAFLQQRFYAAIGDIHTAGLAERLHQWAATLHSLAAAELGAVGTYYKPNPNVKPPLSRPELQALKNLVDLQSNQTLGPLWSDHHASVLHAEAARQLSEIAGLMSNLGNQAQAVAQTQSQLAAAAEARRRAEEQAKQAAAEAQRRAEEQAREAALKSQQQAEAQAREAAEAQAKQQAEELARQEEAAIYSASSVRIPVAVAAARPAAFGLNGLLPVIDAAGIALEAAVRKSIAAITAAARATGPGLLAGVSLLVYSPKLGNGELPPDFGLALPLSDLDPDLSSQLGHQIREGAGADIPLQSDVPVRLTTAFTQPDKTSVVAIKTGEGIPASVRMVAATPTPSGKSYVVETTDIPPRTLLWTPAVSPPNSSTALPGETSVPANYEGPVAEPIPGRLDVLPVDTVRSFDDLIIWFPADSGLAPIYVMYADRRNEPGVASGQGQAVTGNWLAGAAGDGAPVPSQIAAQLTGKAFGSFKDFREAFWKAVAGDPSLASQFREASLARMANGRASPAPSSGHVGKRQGFELHHEHAIAEGGAVYDIDNIKILTPKSHIEIHRGKDQ